MKNWTAVILTCPNKNSSVAYQKELKLRQEKGLIDKKCLIMSIEDPENPLGSGGATLNALYVIAEALSARNNLRMTQIEVLKDCYILIMHMGRTYPFDIIGKAFSSLPYQDDINGNLLTNFDLLYRTMTDQIAGLNNETPSSDPGIYICSTDMLFIIPKTDVISIKQSPICVLSSLADEKTAMKNGIYFLNETGNVENIHFNPDYAVLSKCTSTNGLFNLISGIVYLNYEVTRLLYSLLLYSPMEACCVNGIDNGASPLCLSLFFDILLAFCDGIQKEEYINGSFKSNHYVPKIQKAILRQARITLWNALHSKSFKIKIITLKENIKHIYMDNESFIHRQKIFHDCNYNFAIENSLENLELGLNKAINMNSIFKNSNIIEENEKLNEQPTLLINSIIKKSNITLKKASTILNCQFSSCNIEIGENSYLTDLSLKHKNLSIPPNFFIQNVDIYFESLECLINLNVVFGNHDNFFKRFNDQDWTILNQKWEVFSSKFFITENDLWGAEVKEENRSLSNAKLYPLVNFNLDKEEMNSLNLFFLINLDINSPNKNIDLVKKWRQSLRLSLEDIQSKVNLEKMFLNRRYIFNIVNARKLVDNVLENKCFNYNSLIRNAVYDGYANEILKNFDEAAIKNCKDLALLPRIMVFISNTLCEMALDLSSLRSGPSMNSSWLKSFQFIEDGQIEEGLISLAKERQNWMFRNDMIIRASRHYEGAMLALIRQATSSFKSNVAELNPIKLEPIINKKNNYNWVEAKCPARLDLAGAWSDTPPITYECPGGSCVTNVAILVNGKKPIGAKARVVQNTLKNNFIRIIMQDSSEDASNKVTFEFNNLDEFRDYNKPQAVACLMKAVFVFTKLLDLNNTEENLNDQLKKKLNGSLELISYTGLPHGSGLGTSSILISCVLKVVWYLMGINVSNETLCYSVLIIEQLMTTNGGWQDQVGGIYGGFKLTSAKNSLPLKLSVRQLNLNDEFLDSINSRLILIYTGLTRLAKDLLLNVLRNWYAISSKIYDNVQELVKNGKKCAAALENANLEEFGECINSHRKQKLIMAPGSEPEAVEDLLIKIEPYVYGIALAGAGGGGFLYALTKEPNCKKKIQSLIDSSCMEIYDARVSNDGIEFVFVN